MGSPCHALYVQTTGSRPTPDFFLLCSTLAPPTPSDVFKPQPQQEPVWRTGLPAKMHAQSPGEPGGCLVFVVWLFFSFFKKIKQVDLEKKKMVKWFSNFFFSSSNILWTQHNISRAFGKTDVQRGPISATLICGVDMTSSFYQHHHQIWSLPHALLLDGNLL